MSKNSGFHFESLLPESILEAVQAQGLSATGSLFPLNSYENRVYEIGLENAEPIVAKFYRPGRWSAEAIAEEHLFLQALVEAEIPVVAPLVLQNPLSILPTLSQTGGIFYAFFPKFRGREHDEITNDDRRWLGRSLGRLHNIGEHFHAPHRMTLSPQSYGTASLEFILTQSFLPPDLAGHIEGLLLQAIQLVQPFFMGVSSIVVHGDCHPGNILWNKNGPHLLDFDDMIMAPPVQDLWMLFNGTEDEKREQRDVFFEGYEVFRRFDPRTLILA